MRRLQIGVLGSAGPEEYPNTQPDTGMFNAAETLGKELALAGCVVISGGKGGVMEAVCRGAKANGGLTVAELAGAERYVSNEFVDVEMISTDIGYRGPSLLVGMCDAVIALGGGAGTLQELAVAYRMQKPVVLLTGYGGWTDRLAELDYLDERQLIKFRVTRSPQTAVKVTVNLLQ